MHQWRKEDLRNYFQLRIDEAQREDEYWFYTDRLRDLNELIDEYEDEIERLKVGNIVYDNDTGVIDYLPDDWDDDDESEDDHDAA